MVHVVSFERLLKLGTSELQEHPLMSLLLAYCVHFNIERPCPGGSDRKDFFKENSSIDHFIVVCLVARPLNESETGVDLVLIETSLLFSR